MNAGRTVRAEPAAARASGLSVFAIDAIVYMSICAERRKSILSG